VVIGPGLKSGTAAKIGKPRVLVAGTPLAIETLQRVVGRDVQIVAAHSVDEALERLKMPADAIVCSVMFNESRMFDFLTRLRGMPQAPDVPIICCRTLDAPLSVARYRAIALASEALGAAVFIDMHSARRAHGPAAADALLREAVLAACRQACS
jgi:CheY-like chemotaxis protein